MTEAAPTTVTIRVCMDCRVILDPPFRIDAGADAVPGVLAQVSHGLCDLHALRRGILDAAERAHETEAASEPGRASGGRFVAGGGFPRATRRVARPSGFTEWGG